MIVHIIERAPVKYAHENHRKVRQVLTSPFLSRTAPVLVWFALSIVASLGVFAENVQLIVAAAATIVVVLLARSSLLRVALVIAMIPVAFTSGPTWSFLSSGALLAFALMRTVEAPVATPLRQLQRHLEWCRRRGETAHLLWVHAPGVQRSVAASALDVFRVTDSVALIHEGDGDTSDEIVAMVDATNFERPGIERRLRAYLGDGPGLGWANFPDDGLTIEALFDRARERALVDTKVVEKKDEIQPFSFFRRWSRTTPATAPARSPQEGQLR